MQSFRFGAVQVATLGVLLAGCVDGAQCSRPLGSFSGTYVPLNGNCTTVKSRDIRFDPDKQLSTSDTLVALSDSVTTDIDLIGCTIVVEQSISTAKDKRMIAMIKGSLAVEDATALSGTLDYQEFLPDGVTPACSSQVAVSYVKAAGSLTAAGTPTTLGAAAAAALASP